MSTVGLEQHVIDQGFTFAGDKVAVDLPAPKDELFDAADAARLYTKVHADLGMIADPDEAGEIILGSMEDLHATLKQDRLPGDVEVLPFFPIDLPEREGAFEEGERAFNNQLTNIPDMYVYRPLYSQLSPEQLNRRSFAGETAIKGFDARAMIMGGNREDAPGLLFTDMSAAEQIEAYKALRTSYESLHPNSALALLNAFDHLVINAAIRETNESTDANKPLLDHNTFSRTPQAGDPETGLVEASGGDSWVPYVYSIGGRVYLRRSNGSADSLVGLRVSAGSKQA